MSLFSSILPPHVVGDAPDADIAVARALLSLPCCAALPDSTREGVARVALATLDATRDGHAYARIEDPSIQLPSELFADADTPDASAPTPFVVVRRPDHLRCFTRNAWDAEQRIVSTLRTLTTPAPTPSPLTLHPCSSSHPEGSPGLLTPPSSGQLHATSAPSPLTLHPSPLTLHPSPLTPAPGAPGLHPGQLAAVRTATTHRLALIYGGPGTGKTFTVFQVLLALQAASGKNLRVALAAPTGKAAIRLRESIETQRTKCKEDPNLSAIADRLDLQYATLHRLLGVSIDGLRQKHDTRDPLPHDLLVIDEVSMLDTTLMARVLRAVDTTRTRLILLGDKNQLPSVEAGAVMAQLIAAGRDGGPLAPNSAELTHSFRFKESSGRGILHCCEAIRACMQGTATAADTRATLEAQVQSDTDTRPVVHYAGTPHDIRDALLREIAADLRSAYLAALESTDPASALARLDTLRILCATREGPLGVHAINALIHDHLRALAPTLHPDTRPIIITRNDYAQGLFNGDIGIILHADGALHAHFPKADDAPADAPATRTFALSQLPGFETAYALTIHKSQGSEYTRVAIVFPTTASPILSRELLYTAISRARTTAQLFTTPATLSATLSTTLHRNSMIAEHLNAASGASGE